MGIRGILRRDPFQIYASHGSLSCDKNFYAKNIPGHPNNVWFVSQANGNDSYGGKSWARPLLTIGEAISRSNAMIDWDASPWLVDNWIYVAAGEYTEVGLVMPSSCHIIGMGLLGTDTAVEIHPATGAVFAGTALGTHFHNLRLEVTEADKDTIDLGTANDSLIENCELVCGTAAGGAATAFLSTENAAHMVVRNCSFQYGGAGSSHKYGIYFGGGADNYAHHCDINGNLIQGIRSAGTGIYVAADCTASNAVIRNNIIKIDGAAKGIDDNNGNTLCVENCISIAGAGDAIEHAGGANFTINNQVVVNTVAARETA